MTQSFWTFPGLPGSEADWGGVGLFHVGSGWDSLKHIKMVVVVVGVFNSFINSIRRDDSAEEKSQREQEKLLVTVTVRRIRHVEARSEKAFTSGIM